MTPSEHRGSITGRQRAATLALFGTAALHLAWNAWETIPLTGYDAGAHAGYLLTLVDESRLPHPMEGWATFHPPLYYLLGAGIWSLLEPLGPRAVVTGLRALGGIALLAAGYVALRVVLHSTGRFAVAWVAAALVLFLPMAQLSAAMIGNEAFAAGLTALAIPPLLALQRDPRHLPTAAVTGLMAGLAFITKFTGAFVVIACVVPFLRRDFDPSMARALIAGALAGALIAAPVYARNVLLTGTPFPILREHEPTRTQEARNVLRPRRVSDYLWVDPGSLQRPSIYHIRGESNSELRRNYAMTNVWGLTYAAIWYDAFAHRIPVSFHRDGVLSGPLLTALGVIPTLLVLMGYALALAAAVRSRGRSEDAPLVVLASVGLVMFIGFTSWAQSVVAVKGSYLLPLLIPASAFFGRAVSWFARDLQRAALGFSTAAALACAVIFTHGLVFPAQPMEKMPRTWRILGAHLPGSHIAPSVDRLTRGW